jgi:sulfur-carrier protein
VDRGGAEPPAHPLRGGRGLAVVRLPSLLAAEAGRRARFETDAATVAEALGALPVAGLLLDERGALRPLVNVYVDGEDVRERDGLETRLDGTEEIRVIAAIAGGRYTS